MSCPGVGEGMHRRSRASQAPILQGKAPTDCTSFCVASSLLPLMQIHAVGARIGLCSTDASRESQACMLEVEAAHDCTSSCVASFCLPAQEIFVLFSIRSGATVAR